MNEQLGQRIERIIQRDPARRGLGAAANHTERLCRGHVAGAAGDLAANARHVVLVTGFYIPDADPPAAETDGPPGTLLLADVLCAAGIRVTLVTDALCADALHAGLVAAELEHIEIAVCPLAGADEWIAEFQVRIREQGISHLIAVERPGPSHTLESVQTQPRRSSAPLEEFEQRVPEDARDRCHNMRGVALHPHPAGMHRLFEDLPHGVKTIGIGDGANEIGMGTIPWEVLAGRLPDPETAHIACRVAADWTIVAGTSNWGGFALAACFAHTSGHGDRLGRWTPAFHEHVLREIVANGPAVDGVTRRREPTVDGLPFVTYIQAWTEITRLLAVRE